jgi:hypothetical protein
MALRKIFAISTAAFAISAGAAVLLNVGSLIGAAAKPAATMVEYAAPAAQPGATMVEYA